MFKLMIVVGCCLCLVSTGWAGRVVVKAGKMIVRGPVVVR